MILYCLRHAQADHNIKSWMNGDPSKPINLTQLGIQQAKRASAKLKNIKFDIIYVSQFPRTHQTAAIINNTRNIPIKIDKRLNDIRSGVEGKSDKIYNKKLTILSKKQNLSIYEVRIKNGESFNDEIKRVSSFLNSLKKKKYKKVLMIAHYNTIQIVNLLTNHLNLEKINQIKPKNCEIFKFKI